MVDQLLTFPAYESVTVRKKTPLAKDFVPSDNDVLCGKGRECYNHIGNQTFRQIIDMNIQRYSQAESKVQKSGIVDGIVAIVRQRSPLGGFVRQDPKTRVWYEIGDHHAREKVGHGFREALIKRNPEKKEKRRKMRAVNKARRQTATSVIRTSPMLATIENLDSNMAIEIPPPVQEKPTQDPIEPIPLERAPSLQALIRICSEARSTSMAPPPLLKKASSSCFPFPAPALTSLASSTSRDWYKQSECNLSENQMDLLADIDLSDIEDFFDVRRKRKEALRLNASNQSACVAV